jgi:hypothetical protein
LWSSSWFKNRRDTPDGSIIVAQKVMLWRVSLKVSIRSPFSMDPLLSA